MNYILTVLIPTFNNFKAFKRVIKSYRNENRVKIIVADDSTDNLEKNLIKRECSKKGILYFEGTKLLPVDNWNRLIEKVETPFFTLNHHDEYPINISFLDLLNPHDTGLIVMPSTSISNGNSPHMIYTWQQKQFSKICLFAPNASFNLFLAPTASLIVNSKFKEILFDNKLKWYVDCEWYYRLIFKIKKNNFKIMFCNTSRIMSFQAKNSITSSLKSDLKNQILIEKAYLNNKNLLPNKIISFLQFMFLALILLGTKLKQYFLN